MPRLAVLFVLWLASLGSSAELGRLDACPLASQIYPCQCSWDEDLWQPDLYCPHVQSLDQLMAVFTTAYFPTKRFWRIRVSSAPLGALPQDVFGDVGFDEVHLNTCNITSVHPEAFRASKPHMDTLEMYSNMLTDDTFPWYTLEEYPNLWRVHLERNLFSSVPPLTSASLEDLNLGRNPIQYFDQDSFIGTPNLRIINISPELIGFPEDAFQPLEKLEELHLSNNPLGDLTAHRVTLNSPKFSYLYLANTSIANIDPHAITGTTSTRLKLFLEDNQLTKVDEEVFRPLMDRMLDGWGQLELDGNPLVCDCEMYWLLTNATLLAKVRSGACGGVALQDVDVSAWNC